MEDGGGGNNTWKYVGIGCGIAALLSICAVGGCITCVGAGVGGVFAATEAPATAAHAFFTDLREHDTPGAYARMSDTYRASHTEADFTASVAAVPGLDANTDSTFTGRNINGSSATLTGVVATASGPLPTVLTLHDAGGGNWQIDTVIVSGRMF